MALIVRSGRPASLKDLAVQQTKESISWLRDYITAIKHGQWHPYTLTERKVREATRNEPWGPTGTAQQEIADMTSSFSDCQIIFAVLEMRLGYEPEKWRNVYKGLTVLEYLIKRGADTCVHLAKQDFMGKLEDLEKFEHIEAGTGKDQGINVRHKALAIRMLLKDDQRLQQERELFKRKRKTYGGFSRDDMVRSTSIVAAVMDPDQHGSPEGTMRRAKSDEIDRSDLGGFETTPQPNSRPPPLGASASRSGGRGAGEMKGVSMEENKRHLAALQALLRRPENRGCADCQGGGAAARPTWASINTGVFICMRCAGIHRGLGVHISKVRSCTLDTWLPEQVSFLARTGNAVANAYWEARMGGAPKPSPNSPELDGFIHRKYSSKEWAAGQWPPPEPEQQQQQEAGSSSGAALARGSSQKERQSGSGSLWTTPVAAAAGPGSAAPSRPPVRDFLLDFEDDAPPAPAHENGFGESASFTPVASNGPSGAFQAGSASRSQLPIFDLLDFGPDTGSRGFSRPASAVAPAPAPAAMQQTGPRVMEQVASTSAVERAVPPKRTISTLPPPRPSVPLSGGPLPPPPVRAAASGGSAAAPPAGGVDPVQQLLTMPVQRNLMDDDLFSDMSGSLAHIPSLHLQPLDALTSVSYGSAAAVPEPSSSHLPSTQPPSHVARSLAFEPTAGPAPSAPHTLSFDDEVTDFGRPPAPAPAQPSAPAFLQQNGRSHASPAVPAAPTATSAYLPPRPQQPPALAPIAVPPTPAPALNPNPSSLTPAQTPDFRATLLRGTDPFGPPVFGSSAASGPPPVIPTIPVMGRGLGGLAGAQQPVRRYSPMIAPVRPSAPAPPAAVGPAVLPPSPPAPQTPAPAPAAQRDSLESILLESLEGVPLTASQFEALKANLRSAAARHAGMTGVPMAHSPKDLHQPDGLMQEGSSPMAGASAQVSVQGGAAKDSGIWKIVQTPPVGLL